MSYDMSDNSRSHGINISTNMSCDIFGSRFLPLKISSTYVDNYQVEYSLSRIYCHVDKVRIIIDPRQHQASVVVVP